MTSFQVQDAASRRLDEIYHYTRERWGREQADLYIEGLFESFGKIETRRVVSRRIAAEFGVDGYVFRYMQHFVYWRRLTSGEVGIVAILHDQMHQIDRFRDDLGL